MMEKKAVPNRKSKPAEPIFLIRPAVKNLGLDYLHIALIALVVVLVALALSFSGLSATSQQRPPQNCTYGYLNNSCATPLHTPSQALGSVERIIASYSSINSSLALLPYFTLPNSSRTSYLPGSREWLVTLPYRNSFSNITLDYSFLLYDSNLSLATPFQQMLKPAYYLNESVVAPGVVALSGHSACTASNTLPVFLFVDPYAPGAFQSISDAINTSRNPRLNVSYKFLFTGYSAELYKSYGAPSTQLLGRYLLCASPQRNFPQFISNLSTIFFGTPPSNFTLSQVASASGLNYSQMNSCLLDSGGVLENQALLSGYYNISSTPSSSWAAGISPYPRRWARR